MKETMPILAHPLSLCILVSELIQVTMKTSVAGVIWSTVLLLAISRLKRISASPGFNNKARS